MATLVRLKSGEGYYTNDSIEVCLGKIQRSETIVIWWFDSSGTRYTETLWVSDQDVAFLRTESDDG